MPTSRTQCPVGDRRLVYHAPRSGVTGSTPAATKPDIHVVQHQHLVLAARERARRRPCWQVLMDSALPSPTVTYEPAAPGEPLAIELPAVAVRSLAAYALEPAS